MDHVFAQASKAGFTEQATHSISYHPPVGSIFGPLFRPVREDEGNWEDPVDIMGRSSETGHLAQSVAHEISELLNSETVLPDQLIDGEWTGRKIEPRDFLILVQNRKDLHEIIRACKNLDIPIAGADRLRILSNWQSRFVSHS